MAEEQDFEGEETEFEGGGGGGSKKKLLLLIVLPVVLVLGGAAAAYFTGLADPLLAMFSKKPAAEQTASSGEMPKAAESDKAAPAAANTPAVMYALPEMLVNINTAGRTKNFL